MSQVKALSQRVEFTDLHWKRETGVCSWCIKYFEKSERFYQIRHLSNGKYGWVCWTCKKNINKDLATDKREVAEADKNRDQQSLDSW